MANQEHFDLLKQGVDIWNQWRTEYSEILPDLSGISFWHANLIGANLGNANLNGADLGGADLSGANLYRADLCEAKLGVANLTSTNFSFADLRKADLTGSNLTGANLHDATLVEANLTGANLNSANMYSANLSDATLISADLTGAKLVAANLYNANLWRANLNSANLSRANLVAVKLMSANMIGTDMIDTKLHGADLSRADLSFANLHRAVFYGTNLSNANFNGTDLTSANLSRAILVETNLTGANLTNCSVYGIAAWNVRLDEVIQENLVITPENEPTITVDNLKIAQFIYLLLNNKEIRDVIDTITSKVVLILGRFTLERKSVLDALREALRRQNYLPILFDFEKPSSRDLTETVITLAHLARFIIVDLTDPSSAPHEVATVIPQTVVPVQPLLLQESVVVDGNVVQRREYAMFEDLRRRYHWVLPTFRYRDTDELLSSLLEQIIAPAEQKAKELIQPR